VFRKNGVFAEKKGLQLRQGDGSRVDGGTGIYGFARSDLTSHEIRTPAQHIQDAAYV
jgi:hypothetical protein